MEHCMIPSAPIDISRDQFACETQEDAHSIGSDSGSSPSSRNASSSSLHESLSSGSLENQPPSPSSPSSSLRKHLSTAKPGRSCLSHHHRREPHRKSVTFASDVEELSKENSTEETVGNTLLQFAVEEVNPSHLVPLPSSTHRLEKEHKHSEGLSFKQYHAHAESQVAEDSLDHDMAAEKSTSSDLCSYPINSLHIPSNSSNTSNVEESLARAELTEADERNQGAPNALSISSPLSSLKKIGSQIDQSNCVLQSFMKQAANPVRGEAQDAAATRWSWFVTAPVVLGLIVDTFLG